MDREPDLFMAHLYANNVAGHLLQSHALLQYSGRASLRSRELAMKELSKMAEMFGLELVPRVEVVTR